MRGWRAALIALLLCLNLALLFILVSVYKRGIVADAAQAQSALDPSVARTGGLVGHLLELSGSDRGICAILGAKDADLPVGLARASSLLIHVQTSKAKALRKIRRRLDREGLYGTRVIAEVTSLDPLPYASNLLDAVLCTTLLDADLTTLSVAEVARVLRPGGKAILGRAGGARGKLDAVRLQKWASVEGVRARSLEDRFGVWVQVTKLEPRGVDEWTHWQHGPDNNPVSTDTVIEAPYMTQFLALPYYSPMPSISVIAGGRQFRAAGHMAIHEREEPFINTLFVTNAYNGTMLWTRPLPEGYLVHRSLFVATPDVLYLMEPTQCVLLDPDTGKELDKIIVSRDIAPGGYWKWIALQDDVLYALIGEDELEAEVIKRKRPHGAWGWNELSRGYYTPRYPWGYGNTLLAIDPKSKQVLWVHKEEKPIDSRALCMNSNKLFIHGEETYVACVSAKTGDVLWRNEDEKLLKAIAERNDRGLGFKTTPYALCTDDVLFFAGRGRKNVVGVDADTGRFLWSVAGAYNSTNMLYCGGYLYAHIPSCTMIDPLTGALKKDIGLRKRSCARFTGCPDALFHRGSVAGGEGTTRYDLSTGQPSIIHAFRPPCNDGIIPAAGLLHITQWDCDCNLQLMGGLALCPAGDFEFNRSATEEERLEHTANPQPVSTDFPSEKDWPTYRADASRSASTKATVPANASLHWQYEPAYPFEPTAPTTAGGLIFVAGKDGQVRAIEAASGRERWRFATAGPVRLPPTIWQGRAYVGSGDGYIYCLDAANGRQLWRFRAAPAERRIRVFGSLCSTWPVNTGILVKDGIAYAGAGIINYDGTHVYALDAGTGRIKWQNNTSGHLNPELRAGVSVQGDLAIAADTLIMAGGNVTSPGVYDLANGHCLMPPPQPGPPSAPRGSEVAFFLNKYTLVGGQRLFTDPHDPISTWQPYMFLGEGVAPNKALPGRVPPAFGNGAVAIAGQRGPLVCADADKVEEWLKTRDKRARIKHRWALDTIRASVATAIAGNAIIAIGQPSEASGESNDYGVFALDLQTGKELWRYQLESPPVPGGLCIAADGSVFVVLEQGKLVCLR